MARMSNARSIEGLFSRHFFSFFFFFDEREEILFALTSGSFVSLEEITGIQACRKDVWFRREDFYVS